MEFLKSCTTNAQAIGDYEAIAYQAFSITRDTDQPPPQLRESSPSDHGHAVEAELRRARELVTQDASRPWLWHFKSITIDLVGQDTIELPAVEGYRLHREQFGFMKASEMARPPMRPGNPNTFSHPATSAPSTSNSAPQRGTQSSGARPAQGHNQAALADQPLALDCFTVYELFASAITALISYSLVKSCGAVALNYRTFLSKPKPQYMSGHVDIHSPSNTYWLTSVHVHWISAGTLLLSTNTQRTYDLRCLDHVEPEDEKHLLGECIRIAPNSMLAKITSFEDPLDAVVEEASRRVQRKKAKTGSLEQKIEKWKSSVERWLGWKGYALPNLDSKTSWVRIRIAQSSHVPVISPGSISTDRDVLWPRALCFIHRPDQLSTSIPHLLSDSGSHPSMDDLSWFESRTTSGFKDPIDVAQEWFLGKIDRDKIVEARRKARKAEEDAARRKEEPPGLYPSSPFNARVSGYGDLQPVSGVYPTPPDGIAPGTGLSSTDTPSVSGAPANVVLVPGGNNPAINLSAPQDPPHLDEQQHPSTSPAFPSTLDPFQTSAEDDDLFEDMDAEGYGGNGVNEADFDFFDEPDGDDVVMGDAPALPEKNTGDDAKHAPNSKVLASAADTIKEEMSDPLAALENALATPSQPADSDMPDIKSEAKGKEPVSAGRVVSDVSTTQPEPPPVHDIQTRPRQPTPPLSPGVVAKTLQPSPPDKSTSRKEQKSSLDEHRDSFHSLEFSRRLSLVDAKYQEGRFAAQFESDADEDRKPIAPESSTTKSLRDVPLLTRLRYAAGIATISKLPEVASLARADSDSSETDTDSDVSEESEEEVEEVAVVKPPPFLGRLVIPAKRKLPTEGHGTPMSVTSFAESFGGDWQELNGLQFDEHSLTQFEPSTWDWPLLSVPPPLERPLAGARYAVPSLPPSNAQYPDTPTSQPDTNMEMSDEKPLNGKDSIAVTQIVTEQVISATLDLLSEDHPQKTGSNEQSSDETRWQTIFKRIFPKATDCTVSALVAVHDVFPDLSAQAKGQQRLPPRKPNESNSIPGNHMYQMNPPFVRVRRADTCWDLLPPSIAFWEPLGLSPVSASKNVVAFCVYPHSDALRPILERFLLNIQLAYDTCKLGSHARVETVIEYEGGLVPVKVTSPISQREAFKALRETCIQLGKLLAIQHAQIREQQDAKIDAFVIYMVDPFGNPAALWELCSAFWALFQAYGQGPQGRPEPVQKPDLVLQVIPIKYLASFDVLVALDASTYVNLAREVYDRCPPSAASTDKTPLSIYKAPSFQLEESLPRNIQFKLISEPPQDLLRENSYMHLAYAISPDGTWVTAAWTDSCGKSQAVVSYHLGTRVFGEIAKEIWQTTIEILQSRRVQWRVCIARSGPMEREELETWVLLITCPTQVNLFLTLLTVVEDSPYKFTPAAPPTNSSGQPSATTPGSTPQPGVSPDPAIGLTPAATPSADAPDPSTDSEARLIDITDETWGVILAHRLHNSNSTNQFSPALISGLLVKRGETHSTSNSTHHPSPGPITTAVNILWIGAVGSTRAATSPFPPATDGVSPGGYGAGAGSSTPQSPSPAQERSTSSLMWTPTVQTRATAENLLKEVLAQFRALGLLAKLRGMRGTRHGSLPWHVVAAKRGVEGLGRVTGGGGGGGV